MELGSFSLSPPGGLRSLSHFPEHFLWGVATSAHQVEGGNENNQWFEWERAGGIKSG